MKTLRYLLPIAFIFYSSLVLFSCSTSDQDFLDIVNEQGGSQNGDSDTDDNGTGNDDGTNSEDDGNDSGNDGTDSGNDNGGNTGNDDGGDTGNDDGGNNGNDGTDTGNDDGTDTGNDGSDTDPMPIGGTWRLENASIADGTAFTTFQDQDLTVSFTLTSTDEDTELVFSENPNEVTGSGNYTSVLTFTVLGNTVTEEFSSESPFSTGSWELVGNELQITSGTDADGTYEVMELGDNVLVLKTTINRPITTGEIELDATGELVLSFIR